LIDLLWVIVMDILTLVLGFLTSTQPTDDLRLFMPNMIIKVRSLILLGCFCGTKPNKLHLFAIYLVKMSNEP
ncbi:MAG: hypothetical protein AB4058_09280, partial [Microcystaceae cyanobacterium]